MSGWAAKRFWTNAEVASEESGFTVRLDGRPVRTPLKSPLVVPTRAFADRIATEWQEQEDVVEPQTMPFTRAANSAIDKVSQQADEVADMLAAYAETDLLCYRATAPDALIARQMEAWDPLLDWAAEEFQARLIPTSGVLPVDQDPQALANLAAPVREMSPFQLAGFHDLVALSGSLVIAFAAARDQMPPETLWEVSRIDETWQSEQWGEDEEATEVMGLKRQDFLRAKEIFDLSSD